MFLDDTLEEQKLCDKAQAVAGREYRQLRALMLTGDASDIASAEARLRNELPEEMANDLSFERLLRAMEREVARVSEQDIAIEA
jgi:hypothetical protein